MCISQSQESILLRDWRYTKTTLWCLTISSQVYVKNRRCDWLLDIEQYYFCTMDIEQKELLFARDRSCYWMPGIDREIEHVSPIRMV